MLDKGEALTPAELAWLTDDIDLLEYHDSWRFEDSERVFSLSKGQGNL